MEFQTRSEDVATSPRPLSPISGAGQPPVPVEVFSILLQIFSIMLLTYFIHSRWPSWKTIKTQPFISWINVVLYIDSLMFTMAQMITRYAFGLNSSFQACQSAVMFCLSFYLSTKLLIYFYFTERSFLVWSARTEKRSRNFFYVFNMTVIIGGYIAVIVSTYIFRINDFSLTGQCIIGIERRAGIPLATYETCINIYLTFLFLFPLRKVYGYQTRKNARLRKMAIRCLIGTSITTLSTGANLATVVALNGERAWLCLMLCNLDIVVSVVVLHWVTSFGKSTMLEPRPSKSIAIWNTSNRVSTAHTPEIEDDDMQLPSWNDPTVTTYITYGHGAVARDPVTPNGISVHREHSRRVETIGPQSTENAAASVAHPGVRSSLSYSDSVGKSFDSTKSSNNCATGGTEALKVPRPKSLARLSLPDVRERDSISQVHLKDLKTMLTQDEMSSSRNLLSRTGSSRVVSEEEENVPRPD